MTVMEKKLTNSGPLIQSTRKHSIYTPAGDRMNTDRHLQANPFLMGRVG